MTWKRFPVSAMVSDSRNDSGKCVNVRLRPKADITVLRVLVQKYIR